MEIEGFSDRYACFETTDEIPATIMKVARFVERDFNHETRFNLGAEWGGKEGATFKGGFSHSVEDNRGNRFGVELNQDSKGKGAFDAYLEQHPCDRDSWDRRDQDLR